LYFPIRQAQVIEIGYSVDWFSGTKITGPLIFDTAFPQDMGQTVSTAKPRNGYNRGDMLRCGAVVLYHSKYRDMGYHAQFDGASLRELRMVGMTDTQIVRRLSSMAMKASRIDVAMDVFGSESLTVPAIANAVERGDIIAVTKKATYTHGVGGSANGATLYLGSRTSERMLRVYDKAAEQGIDGMRWLRLEFEIKEEQAHAVQRALVVNNEIAGIFRAIWASFVKKCAFVELDQAIGSTSVTIPDVPRKAHSTVVWLLDQVVPAMVNFQEQHPEIDILDLVVNAFTEYKG
jgi:hypothetical protein